MLHAKPFTEEIGRFVRGRRKAAQLNQHELADLAGVGQRFISELERGKATIRLAEVDKVLAVFGKQIGLIDRLEQQDDEQQDDEQQDDEQQDDEQQDDE